LKKKQRNIKVSENKSEYGSLEYKNH